MLQTSAQCLRWFLPFLVGLPPLLPCDMNSSRACYHCHLHHWHISHSLNTSGIRSSLCWVSHWANCCFAQARYHLEQLLLFFLQPFIPHPWPIFMDSSMNSDLNSCATLGFLTWPSSNFGLVTSQEGVWCWSCPIGFAGFHFCGLQLEKGSSFPPIFQVFFPLCHSCPILTVQLSGGAHFVFFFVYHFALSAFFT